jgi:hypothetical protein
MIFDYQFFLGFPLDSSYEECLQKVSPSVLSLFIQNNSQYLQQMTYKDSLYLGKPLGFLIEVQRLELFQDNVYSLLRRLVPDYRYEEYPLVLFPIPVDLVG